MIGGPRRKSRIISEHEKKVVAYHEGGHTLAAWAMPDLDPIYKVTILARGRTGGHALAVPEQDKDLMTRSEMIARLVMAMGGRAAEELVFHEPTTGASSDIDQATKIARAMVTEYGMSAKLGAVRYGQDQGDPFLGRSMGSHTDYSAEIAGEIDDEVRRLIEAAHTEAWAILSEYRDTLDVLATELLEKETLTRKDLEKIFSEVQKRPRITAFNEFGERTPSDKPPVKTPGELAIERGEPWPPEPEPVPEPVGVAGYPGGPQVPGQVPSYPPGTPGQAYPGGPQGGAPYPHYPNPQYPNPQYPNPQYPNPQYPNPQYPNPQYPEPHPGSGSGTRPDYGAPRDWSAPGWPPQEPGPGTNGTGANGNGPNGTGPNGTGPNGTDSGGSGSGQ